MKNIFPLIICCFIFNITKAQNTKVAKKNALYLEAGGNGLFYSINYDRIVPISPKVKIAPRLGISYLPYNGGNKFKNFIIPFEVNILYAKQAESKNFIEGGVGLTLFEFVKGFRNGNKKDPVSQYSNVTMIRVGFRHQKTSGGLMYRAGLLIPVAQDSYSESIVGDDIFFRIWAGFGIGCNF